VTCRLEYLLEQKLYGNLFFIDKTFILIKDPTIAIAKYLYYLHKKVFTVFNKVKIFLNFTHECSVKIILHNSFPTHQ